MIPALFTSIIVLSAFLLFQIQPILSKEQLPLFGGGASVWSASLFFYQSFLLCGYLYAHYMSRIKVKAQIWLHLILMATATAVTFSQVDKSTLTMLPPPSSVLINLLTQVGPIFVILSATSILMQHWYSAIFHKSVPYHWYGWSNLGSLVALLSFPFIFEVYFNLTMQKQIWITALALLVVLVFMLSVLLSKHKPQTPIQKTSTKSTHFHNKRLLCVVLAACSSMSLISTTQMINVNIPPMPLTWTIPLVIYLLTFIAAFWLPAPKQSLYTLAALIFAVFAGVLMYFLGGQFSAIEQLSMYCLIQLICCFVCHRTLKSIAPTSQSMTSFYLCIAVGSVIGSLLCSIIAPTIFNQLLEYPITLFLVFFIHLPSLKKATATKSLQFIYALTLTVAIGGFTLINQAYTQLDIASERNFYGFISVKDVPLNTAIERRLIDGTTIHGTEVLEGQLSNQNSYYHAQTGVAKTLNALQSNGPLNIGIIGLGAGTLSKYAMQQDKLTFYELNPAVHHMAQRYFSYLRSSRADLEVKIGDGRQLIADEVAKLFPPQDAIIIDAFSSDIIPTHLLTVEAMAIYWQRMKSNGVLLMHISNNHIDLMPILLSHSQQFDKTLLLFEHLNDNPAQLSSKWAVLTSNERIIALLSNPATTVDTERHNMITWTDERHSLLPLIML